jgi:pyruvate ferredoxin oxidoreductase beta subunit
MAFVEKLGREELFAPGHRACSGCGETIAIRIICKAAGFNSIIVTPTGCLEIFSSPYPQTAWRLPWIHANFENAAAVASGIESAIKVLKRRGRYEGSPHTLVIAGDGATFDIGFQALSGLLERGHEVLYMCIDNEAYMNTGIQRSGATPYCAWTTTTPVGRYSVGKKTWKKDMPAIVAAHHVPYVATASIAYPLDLFNKVKKALMKLPSYIQVITPCPVGWRFESNMTVKIARLAVQTGVYPLFEMENGKLNMTVRVVKRLPVSEYLKLQGRFRHLTEREISIIQENVDRQLKSLGAA